MRSKYRMIMKLQILTLTVVLVFRIVKENEGLSVKMKTDNIPSSLKKFNGVLIDDYLILAEKLYTNDKFLRTVKRLNENADSKSIVDRATRKPVEIVLKALENLDENNLVDIQNFVDNFFYEPGIEIKHSNLTDWSEEPPILGELKSQDLKTFFKAINKVWLDLYRNFDTGVLENGGISSHLPMKHSFIVPGGRFKEIYYWDSYWTIEGLLVCGMFKTVKQILENFIYFIELFGFIPNGSRVYYLNRSQPPYFSQMVMKYFEFTQNSSNLTAEEKKESKVFVLETAFESMIKEYEFWMRQRSVEIALDNRVYLLNIFKADTKKPRPESYFEDITTASFLSNEKEKEKLYQDIASGAESGHDFSSRLFRNPMKLSTIETSDIIPVDLNAILFKTELIISELASLKGNFQISKIFKRLSIERELAINEILWSKMKKQWVDLNMVTNKPQSDHFYLSNLSPLWFGIKPPNDLTEMELIDLHLRNPIEEYSGVPCSYIYSTEQWDFPNVWAPYQLSLVEMLQKFDSNLSLKLARKNFRSIYKGWKSNDAFYEKYNALSPGERGAGGEYEVQSGFGWTNGVILKLIEIFKDDILGF